MRIGENTGYSVTADQLQQRNRVNPNQERGTQKPATNDAGSFRETLNRTEQKAPDTQHKHGGHARHLKLEDDYQRLIDGQSQQQQQTTVELRLDDQGGQTRSSSDYASQRPAWDVSRDNNTIAEGQITSESTRTTDTTRTQQASELRGENMGHDLGRTKENFAANTFNARVPEMSLIRAMRTQLLVRA